MWGGKRRGKGKVGGKGREQEGELTGMEISYFRSYVCKPLDISSPKLGRWIVPDKSWSPISFEVKRSNVKVGVSLHSSNCQFSSSLDVQLSAACCRSLASNRTRGRLACVEVLFDSARLLYRRRLRAKSTLPCWPCSLVAFVRCRLWSSIGVMNCRHAL